LATIQKHFPAAVRKAKMYKIFLVVILQLSGFNSTVGQENDFSINR